MPSFDIVSEFDKQEARNAVDQANKEVTTRFDFKGSNSSYELSDNKLLMTSGSEFQLQQMLDIVQSKLTKRGVDIACMDIAEPKASGKIVRQEITLKQGIESLLAKKNRQAGQRQKIEGAGRDSGRSSADHRQAARRPTGSDSDVEAGKPGDAVAVYQFPGLTSA